MSTLAKIDGEPIDVDDFIRTLKLTGQFDGLMEQIVRDRLTVRAAKKQGITISDQEVQERADQFRRMRGLHRAADMNRFLDATHIGLEQFEAFIKDCVYQEKVLQKVCDAGAAETYFKLNSPRFDAIELSHIVLENEGQAKEMMSLLQEEPDTFEEMAKEHSIADSRARGGLIGRVPRGSVRADVEAKLFNAAAGDLVGPFVSADRSTFEIFRVNARHPAQLDDKLRAEIQRLLREDWLRARAQEHVIESSPAS
jgi:peptidylprolyl isomerase